MLLRSEVTGIKKLLELNCDQLYKTIPLLHHNENGGGGALGKIVRPVVWFSNLGRDRCKSWKQVVTATLLNVQQQVWASRVLGDDHFKRMARVTVGV